MTTKRAGGRRFTVDSTPTQINGRRSASTKKRYAAACLFVGARGGGAGVNAGTRCDRCPRGTDLQWLIPLCDDRAASQRRDVETHMECTFSPNLRKMAPRVSLPVHVQSSPLPKTSRDYAPPSEAFGRLYDNAVKKNAKKAEHYELQGFRQDVCSPNSPRFNRESRPRWLRRGVGPVLGGCVSRASRMPMPAVRVYRPAFRQTYRPAPRPVLTQPNPATLLLGVHVDRG